MCLLDNSEINRACYWKEKTASSQLVHLISNLHEAYTWIWFGGKFKTQNFRNFGSSVCKHEMSSWESESAIELSWLCLTFPSSIFEIWRLTKTPSIHSDIHSIYLAYVCYFLRNFVELFFPLKFDPKLHLSYIKVLLVRTIRRF